MSRRENESNGNNGNNGNRIISGVALILNGTD